MSKSYYTDCTNEYDYYTDCGNKREKVRGLNLVIIVPIVKKRGKATDV